MTPAISCEKKDNGMTLSQDDLLKIFVEEATEHLSTIENDFLALEKAGDAIDMALVNKVFRTAHSIKGGAGFIGLGNIKELSHKMETVLGRIRSGKLPPEYKLSAVINILLLASDTLKDLVANVASSDKMDISMPMEALNSIVDDSINHAQIQSIKNTQILPPEPDIPTAADVNNRDEGQVPKDGDASIRSLYPSALAAIAKTNLVDIFTEMKISDNDLLQAKIEGKYIYVLRVDFINDVQFHGKSAQEIIDEIKGYGTVLSVRTGGKPDIFSESTDLENHPFLYIAFACVLGPEDASLLLDAGNENLFPVDRRGGFQTRPVPNLPGFEPANTEPVHTEVRTESARTEQGGFGTRPYDNEFPEPGVGKEPFSDTSPASIRVNIHLLDSLMNLAGELVLTRNQLLTAIDSNDHHNTEIVGKRVDLITSDLQKVIMLTRLQPVGNLFNKFPILVRNLSRELGKETVLEIEGAGVELDRTLLEAMSDPLNHLIRNAVDHGIEKAGVRKLNGKGETGKIVLRAFNEAGQVIIEVSDDGAGINPEKVAIDAVSKGFVSEEQVRIMTLKDKLNLIFLPGFSTAQTVSDMSGRGVGMDVVKTNLDNLRGLIDIFSTPGLGTRIKIKLPLTLAIIPCQIISLENERFAIPQVNLEELIRIPASRVKERIEMVGDAEVVRLRGKLLPLVRLTKILGIQSTYTDMKMQRRKIDRRTSLADRRSIKSPMFADDVNMDALKIESAEDMLFGASAFPNFRSTVVVSQSSHREAEDRRYRATSALNIAVVSTGQIKYGLIVDAFCDSEEIVVKPLGRHLKSCRGYAGATIMGDGKVALILDVNNLSEIAGLFSVSGTRRAIDVARAAEKAIKPDAEQLHLLVFRNADEANSIKEEQFALPLNQVLHIEKIRMCDLQSFGGIKAIQYRGGNLPVFSIDEIAKVRPLAVREHLLVIVFMVAGRELGLLAIGPVDSVVTEAVANGSALKQPGIMGSIILNGKTTLLVDVLDLVRNLQPGWFSAVNSPGKLNSNGLATVKGETILVADDSNFFRNQIKSFIQQEGYQVVDAEDGEVAWRILQKLGQDISLVVTDMEMPRLDGFELTATIRKDERFSCLPIIAMTTLADDKDMERAKLAGVNEYQLKLDKEKLLDSIN
ncbi:MAG: chemotaxis protein CheW, partial [Deltaproteobacteria bacterium]